MEVFEKTEVKTNCWRCLLGCAQLGGMSVHLFDGSIAGTPAEPMLLEEVTVRLIEVSERERFDEELATKHYLKNAKAVGRVLRYVAEYRGQWVALVVFSSAAFHLKLRDQWLHWSARQVQERRHLLAQNARFLVLAAPGQWPNLASRVLKLACERLPTIGRRTLVIRCKWWKHSSIRNVFGARFTKRLAGSGWDPPGDWAGLGGIFIRTPGIPRNCGCEFWPRAFWSRLGRWHCPPLGLIPRGPCRRLVRCPPSGWPRSGNVSASK